MEEKVLEFDESSATVDAAAHAIGCEGKEIAKTMSFHVGDDVIVIVMAGDAKVNNRKYKDTFGKKAAMLKGDEVAELTTHPIGGVCSFALPEGVKTYLDVSLKRFEHVYPACGSGNSAIRLTIPELEKYSSNFTDWVDVCTGWEE